MKSAFNYLIRITIAFTLLTGCEKVTFHPYNHPLNGRTTAVFNPDKKYGKVWDIDGNEYKTIVIGNQIWMAENLRVTRYRNGDTIPNVTGNEEWSRLTTGAYCNYNNTSNPDTIATYGRLYNWYAATDSRNIAPEGWRVATVEDWDTLVNYLGGYSVAGLHLKEAGGFHWNTPINIENPDNSSGFTALPGGWWRYHTQHTEMMSYFGFWWTTVEGKKETGYLIQLFCWDATVSPGFVTKKNGCSIRCIKKY